MKLIVSPSVCIDISKVALSVLCEASGRNVNKASTGTSSSTVTIAGAKDYITALKTLQSLAARVEPSCITCIHIRCY